MKKTASIIIAILLTFIFVSCNKMPEESGSLQDVSENTAAFYAPTDTKIFNDFAAQLPEFDFNNTVENYDESLSFVFSVRSNSEEFNKYVDALKAKGFTGGTEGAPVSGEGYYKAINAERYMVEAVLENGVNLTVTVTRP